MRPPSPNSTRTRQTGQDADAPLFQLLPPSLPTVLKTAQDRLLLKAGPIPQQSNVLALDFMEGCGHGCPFCPSRIGANGQALGDLRMADNLVERLTDEILDLPARPRAV